MNKLAVGAFCLALCTTGPITAQNNITAGTSSSGPNIASPQIDRTILHVQVILDRLGFAPGVIDGKEGQSLTVALTGFQQSRGLPTTGKIDQATLRALYPYRAIRPTSIAVIAESDVAGPFIYPTPDEPEDQAKLPGLFYQSPLEKLAERFHTTPATLVALNSPETPLRAGTRIVVPSAIPASRDYPMEDETVRALFSSLNVDARQPKGDRVVVDKSEGALKVFAGERLIAQFPATMGSEHDPLPLGEWTIKGTSYNPPFHYNPDLFWDADANDQKTRLPPGPNGPVGVAWIDLSKPHYGIHGTSEPQTIGRAESHGCIRLSNWDVLRLSLMVKPGTRAIFQA